MEVIPLVFLLCFISYQLSRIANSLEHLQFDIREVDDEEYDEENENEQS